MEKLPYEIQDIIISYLPYKQSRYLKGLHEHINKTIMKTNQYFIAYHNKKKIINDEIYKDILNNDIFGIRLFDIYFYEYWKRAKATTCTRHKERHSPYYG
jgi:hypothetical protein